MKLTKEQKKSLISNLNCHSSIAKGDIVPIKGKRYVQVLQYNNPHSIRVQLLDSERIKAVTLQKLIWGDIFKKV